MLVPAPKLTEPATLKKNILDRPNIWRNKNGRLAVRMLRTGILFFKQSLKLQSCFHHLIVDLYIWCSNDVHMSAADGGLHLLSAVIVGCPRAPEVYFT